MKFQLEQKGVRYVDEDLLADLRRVSTLTGRRYVPRADYEKHGSFSRATLAKRFGSWKAAHERAGLDHRAHDPATKKQLVDDLRRVANELGKDHVSISEYRSRGKWSERPYYKNFGGWAEALAAAELQEHPQFKRRLSDDEYFENLEHMWRALGRQPRYGEVVKPFSKISAGAYEGRFGSWRSALEAFVQFVEKPAESEEVADLPQSLGEPSSVIDKPSPISIPRRRTPRTPSLRLRVLVMRRDNFRCCQCGGSPALSPGLVLHIDHIRAWAKGGETVLDNLQTLCADCNFGKSDLPSSE